jgi:hypothetical protein
MLQNSCYKIHVANFTLQNSRYKIHVTKFMLQNSCHKIDVTKFTLQNSRYKINVTKFMLQNSCHSTYCELCTVTHKNVVTIRIACYALWRTNTSHSPSFLRRRLRNIIPIAKNVQWLAKYMLKIVRSILTQHGQNMPQSQFCRQSIQISDISTYSGVHNK